MATRTISAAGGTRNWSDTATWDEGIVPTNADDVVARGDGTSGNVTVTGGSVCRSLDFTNYVGVISGSSTLNIGGAALPGSNVAIKLVAGMTWSHTGSVGFVSTVTGGTITMAGKAFGGAVTFNGVGGGWTFQDAFSCGGQTLTVTAGTLDLNGKAVTMGSFTCSGATTRSVTFGAATVTTTGTAWNFSGSNLTLSAASATINFARTSGTQTFTPAASQTWGTINVTGTAGFTIATTATTITTLAITPGGAITVTLPAGVTTTVTTLSITGTAGNVVTVVSSTAASAATLSVAAGSVTATYVSLKDNTATGGATFQANHATIQTNVTGWTVVGTGTIAASVTPTSSGARVSTGTGTIAASVTPTSTGKKAGFGTGTLPVLVNLNEKGARLGPVDFTVAWIFTPDGPAADDAGGQLTIVGTPPGEDDRAAVEVGYDSQRFTLTIADTATVQSSVQAFDAGDRIFLAVRISDDGLALTVKAGDAPIEHVRDATVKHAGVLRFVELLLGVSSATWGGGTWGSGTWGGASRPAGVVENLMGFEDALSDAEIETLATAEHRMDGLPTPEARLVWFVPFDPRPVPVGSLMTSGRRFEAATAGSSTRLADDRGLTKALAVLDSDAVGTDGLAVLTTEDVAEFAAFLATTNSKDDLADHHAQFAAASEQEVRVR